MAVGGKLELHDRLPAARAMDVPLEIERGNGHASVRAGDSPPRADPLDLERAAAKRERHSGRRLSGRVDHLHLELARLDRNHVLGRIMELEGRAAEVASAKGEDRKRPVRRRLDARRAVARREARRPDPAQHFEGVELGLVDVRIVGGEVRLDDPHDERSADRLAARRVDDADRDAVGGG